MASGCLCRYKQGEPEIADPVLAGSLREKGLLHYLLADSVVDKVVTTRLYDAVTELAAAGAFDALPRMEQRFMNSRCRVWGSMATLNSPTIFTSD